MVVELEKLPECMRIWDIKEWLTDPSKNYPLVCHGGYSRFCRCHGIVETLWYDETFRRILSAAGIDRNDERSTTWKRIRREIMSYAKKLYSGEEMVSNSSRSLNVLTSSHAKRLAALVKAACRCKEHSESVSMGQLMGRGEELVSQVERLEENYINS